MAQAEITIRMVLPEGVERPPIEADGRPYSLCQLVGEMIYKLFPDVAQEVQVDIDDGVVSDGVKTPF